MQLLIGHGQVPTIMPEASKSGGEEKTECSGNAVFSRVARFREYSI